MDIIIVNDPCYRSPVTGFQDLTVRLLKFLVVARQLVTGNW